MSPDAKKQTYEYEHDPYEPVEDGMPDLREAADELLIPSPEELPLVTNREESGSATTGQPNQEKINSLAAEIEAIKHRQKFRSYLGSLAVARSTAMTRKESPSSELEPRVLPRTRSQAKQELKIEMRSLRNGRRAATQRRRVTISGPNRGAYSPLKTLVERQKAKSEINRRQRAGTLTAHDALIETFKANSRTYRKDRLGERLATTRMRLADNRTIRIAHQDRRSSRDDERLSDKTAELRGLIAIEPRGSQPRPRKTPNFEPEPAVSPNKSTTNPRKTRSSSSRQERTKKSHTEFTDPSRIMELSRIINESVDSELDKVPDVYGTREKVKKLVAERITRQKLAEYFNVGVGDLAKNDKVPPEMLSAVRRMLGWSDHYFAFRAKYLKASRANREGQNGLSQEEFTEPGKVKELKHKINSRIGLFMLNHLDSPTFKNPSNEFLSLVRQRITDNELEIYFGLELGERIEDKIPHDTLDLVREMLTFDDHLLDTMDRLRHKL